MWLILKCYLIRDIWVNYPQIALIQVAGGGQGPQEVGGLNSG